MVYSAFILSMNAQSFKGLHFIHFEQMGERELPMVPQFSYRSCKFHLPSSNKQSFWEKLLGTASF